MTVGHREGAGLTPQTRDWRRLTGKYRRGSDRQSVGRSVGWSVGWSVGQLVDQLVVYSAGRSIGWSIGQQVSWLICLLVGWVAVFFLAGLGFAGLCVCRGRYLLAGQFAS